MFIQSLPERFALISRLTIMDSRWNGRKIQLRQTSNPVRQGVCAVRPEWPKIMGAWVGVGLASWLGGCTVTSQTPLFNSGDAASPPLAQGRWAVHGPGCDVTPLQALPDCAVPFAIDGERMILDAAAGPVPMGSLAGGDVSGPMGFLLVKGDPQILQFSDPSPPNTPAPPVPAATEPGAPVTPGHVNYMAFRPVHRNVAGETDDGIAWPIVCPKDVAATPGLTGQGQICQATTPAAVRGLAGRMPPLLSYFMTWVGPAKSGPTK